eukprot:scaffold16904_cov101-Isochrysis_galbana.AAC.6
MRPPPTASRCRAPPRLSASSALCDPAVLADGRRGGQQSVFARRAWPSWRGARASMAVSDAGTAAAWRARAPGARAGGPPAVPALARASRTRGMSGRSRAASCRSCPPA